MASYFFINMQHYRNFIFFRIYTVARKVYNAIIMLLPQKKKNNYSWRQRHRLCCMLVDDDKEKKNENLKKSHRKNWSMVLTCLSKRLLLLLWLFSFRYCNWSNWYYILLHILLQLHDDDNNVGLLRVLKISFF